MVIAIKYIDLLKNGTPVGLDLPVDWTVEIDDNIRNIGWGYLKFIKQDAEPLFVSVEPTNCAYMPTTHHGLWHRNGNGNAILIFKTDTRLK